MPTYLLDPGSDAKTGWTTFPTPAVAQWSNINKAVRQPTAPSTSSGIRATTAVSSATNLLNPTLDLYETVTNLKLWVYCLPSATGSGNVMSIEITPATANTLTISKTFLTAGIAVGWQSTTAVPAAFNLASSSGIAGTFSSLAGATGTNNIYSVYLELTTSFYTPNNATILSCF